MLEKESEYDRFKDDDDTQITSTCCKIQVGVDVGSSRSQMASLAPQKLSGLWITIYHGA